MKLSKTIDSLFAIDQKLTQKVNDGFFLFRFTIHGARWLSNNKKQFEIIDSIIKNRGFPGEKIIGLPQYYNDSLETYEFIDFYGPYLRQWQAYFMLLHYFTNRRKVPVSYEYELYKNVSEGNLTPFQYANICYYIRVYGHNAGFDNFYIPSFEINKKRQSIGLYTLEQEQMIEMILRDRRGKRIINKEIFLE